MVCGMSMLRGKAIGGYTRLTRAYCCLCGKLIAKFGREWSLVSLRYIANIPMAYVVCIMPKRKSSC